MMPTLTSPCEVDLLWWGDLLNAMQQGRIQPVHVWFDWRYGLNQFGF